MARITVEDCVKKIDRFSLVIVASQRVREIEGGAPLTIPREDDKFPVVALREIANGSVDLQKLETAFMRSFQKQRLKEEWDDNLLDDDLLLADTNLEKEFPGDEEESDKILEEKEESVQDPSFDDENEII